MVFLLIIPTVAAAEYDYNSKEFQAVVTKLDMQGHANDDLATCNVKQMYFEEVSEMLNEGMSSEEILQYYVSEYGQAALREPAKDKNGIMAWAMPIVGIVVGVSIVSIWLRRLKGKNKNEAAQKLEWESDVDKEITAKIFEEERRKHF